MRQRQTVALDLSFCLFGLNILLEYHKELAADWETTVSSRMTRKALGSGRLPSFQTIREAAPDRLNQDHFGMELSKSGNSAR